MELLRVNRKNIKQSGFFYKKIQPCDIARLEAYLYLIGAAFLVLVEEVVLLVLF